MNRQHPDIHGDIPYLMGYGVVPDFGTPGQARRLREARINRLWRAAWKLCIWFLILAGAYIAGLNTRQEQAQQIKTGIEYRMKAARLHVGESACELDPQGCLICAHREARGILVATHC